jgi:Ca2+-binding RTX toxin-like protein
MILRPCLAAALAAALATLLVPAAAGAATLDNTAGAGPSSEPYIVYTAGKHEKNRLTISTAKRSITFSDPGARIKRAKGSFPGCRYSRHKVVCKIDPLTDLVVDLGDGNDSVRFKGKDNATTYGPSPRTEAKDTDDLNYRVESYEGENTEHANISGGPGNDSIRGTNSRDVLDGGPGKDVVDGGGGYDEITDNPDGQPDTIFGGAGVDYVGAQGVTTPITIDLTAQTLTSGTEVDRIDSFERAEGSEGNDVIKGTEGRDGLFGGGGDDTVDGLGGADYLGGDNNLGSAKAGADTLDGGAGDDVLDGRDGVSDTAFAPIDKLVCGDGADTIFGRQDDLADATCESSAFGSAAPQSEFNTSFDLVTKSGVQPVSRGPDGAPTYAISCPKSDTAAPPCEGSVQLQQPPAPGPTAGAELGTATFSIPRGTTQNVTIALNPSGKTALAQPKAVAAVHVAVAKGVGADFGWQQQLGP